MTGRLRALLVPGGTGSWQVVWEQATAVPNDIDLFVQSLVPAD